MNLQTTPDDWPEQTAKARCNLKDQYQTLNIILRPKRPQRRSRSIIYYRPVFLVRTLHSTFQSAGEVKNLLSTLGFNVDIVQVTPGIMRGEIRASHHPEALAIEIQSNHK